MIVYRNLNRVWSFVKGTFLRSAVQREQDLPLAMDMLRAPLIGTDGSIAVASMKQLLAIEPILAGAGVGFESRRWLIPASYTAASWASTGDKDTFPVHDFLTVVAIAGTFTTAGTTTPVRIEFDRRVTQGSDTSRVAMLDGTNAFLLAPNASAAQALGNVLYKDIGHTVSVDLEPNDEVVSEVTTACTAGVGRSIVYVVPRSKLLSEATGAVASS